MAAAFVLLGLCLAATVYAYLEVTKRDEERARERFAYQLKVDRACLNWMLGRYFDTMRTVASLTETALDEDKWQGFMQNMGWRTRVWGFHELGYAEFVQTNGTYEVPIRFIVTKLTNSTHVVGFDLAAQPEHQKAIMKCGETGSTATASDVILTSKPGEKDLIGHVAFTPCYGYVKSEPAPFLSNRTLRGFVFSTYSELELWEDFFRRVRESPISYGLKGYPAEKTLSRSPEKLRERITITGWGKRWELLCVAGVGLRDPGARYTPLLILVSGVTASLLLFVLWMLKAVRQRDAFLAAAGEEKLKKEFAEKTAENIRELRTANEQLHSSLAREQELGQMKSNFVSTVSHEFRTPLGIIVSSAGILERYLERLTPAQRTEHLQNIQQASARMTDLMEGALLFGKADSGHLEFAQKPVNLPDLCRRIAGEIGAANNGRCPIEFEVNGSFDGARADETLLRAILTNLLGNAVKYSPSGVPVRFQLVRRDGLAIFTITDEGIGIPAADLPKLFSPFQRGQNAANYSGTGLGLALVKKCVQLHGGTIDIQSREGRGTTAVVELPLFNVEERKLMNEKHPGY